MTGALTLQGATAAANVLRTKLAADSNGRFQIDADGKLEWGSGIAAPTKALSDTLAGGLSLNTDLYPLASVTNDLGTTTLLWRQFYARDVNAYSDTGFVRVGASGWATAGAVRLKNATAVSWRNQAGAANLDLTVNASNVLTFNGLVVVTQAALDALTTRVATLEAQMAGPRHTSGTIDVMGGAAVMP